MRDGQMHHVVMQAPKNGFFYILDAKSGKLLSADKFVPETNWADHIDMKTGRPVENPEARYSATGKPAIIMPAALGMHNWHPMAYSPDTGYVYIPVTISSAAYGARRISSTIRTAGTPASTSPPAPVSSSSPAHPSRATSPATSSPGIR